MCFNNRKILDYFTNKDFIIAENNFPSLMETTI